MNIPHRPGALTGAVGAGVLLVVITGAMALARYGPGPAAIATPVVPQPASPAPARETIASSTATPAPSAPGLPLPNQGLAVESLDALEPISPLNMARLTEVGRVGNGNAWCAAWSYDGKWLAVSASTGAYIRDAQAFEPVGALDSGPTTAIAFSPVDSTLLAVVSDGSVSLWNVTTGVKARTLVNGIYTTGCYAVAFSPDGKWLAATVRKKEVGSQRRVNVWDVSSGRLLNMLHGDRAEFAPDGSLAVWQEGNIHILAVSTGQVRQTVAAVESYELSDISFSPDGERLSLAWTYTTAMRLPPGRLLTVWNLTTGEEERRVDAVDLDMFVPAGNLGFNSRFGTVVDIATGAEVRRLSDYPEYIASAAFAPVDNRLAVASYEGLGIWDVRNGARIKQLDSFVLNFDPGSWSAGQQALATLINTRAETGDMTIGVWNLLTGKNVRRLELHEDLMHSVTLMTFTPDERRVLMEQSCTIRVLNVDAGTFDSTRPRLCGSVEALSPDGEHFVMTSIMPGARKVETSVWSLSRQAPVFSLGMWDDSWQSPLGHMAFSPDGALLAVISRVGENDTIITVYEVPTGRIVSSFAGPPPYTYVELVFSPDHSLLASSQHHPPGVPKTTVTVWKVESGEKILTRTLPRHIGHLIFSPDGTPLAVDQPRFPSGRKIEFTDLLGGRRFGVWLGQYAFVNRVGFSADGRLLITSEEHSILRLWGVPRP